MPLVEESQLSLEVAKLYPPLGHWSEEEYLSLDTNRLVEFSDGSIKVLDHQTETHHAALGYLLRNLMDFVRQHGLGKVSFGGLPMKLWMGKFRTPDVLFMLAEHSGRRTNKFWNGADLVMEVVSEDRTHDLETKRSEYARAGIPEYWIIDPKLQEITELKLVGEAYEVAGIGHRGNQVVSVLLPGFAVDVTAVFEAK